MFTAEELADLRAEQSASMPASCVISNPTADTDDAAGGSTPGTPTTVSTSCRIGVPNASDLKYADRQGVLVDTVITVPYGTIVSTRGTIACSTNGKSYDVVYINSEQSYGAAVRIGCLAIRSET